MMDDREKKSGWSTGVILLIAVLPILYVGGIGPAAWVANEFPSTEPTLALIYYPILVAGETFEPLGRLIVWYIEIYVTT